MKRFGALAIAVVMTVAACGGSDDTVLETDVEVEAVDDVLQLAGGGNTKRVGQVINGCSIKPRAWCPDADLRDANLSGANLYGVTFCNTIMPDGSVRNDGC